MPRKKVVDSSMTFAAVFEPDEGGWHVYLPRVQGCRTWGRSLAEARKNIREALACCSDLFADPAAVARTATFEENIRWPKTIQAAARRVERARARREALAAKTRAEESAGVREITELLSLRDAGELLGLSQEGVRKLLKVG